jgi:hypothetical protein
MAGAHTCGRRDSGESETQPGKLDEQRLKALVGPQHVTVFKLPSRRDGKINIGY